MYNITATQDFMDLLGELPVKYLAILSASFVKIEKVQEPNINTIKCEENTFIEDLLAQIRNGELE